MKLVRGFLVVQTHHPTSPEATRDLVEGWYRERAHNRFPERIAICLDLFPNPEASGVRRTANVNVSLFTEWQIRRRD